MMRSLLLMCACFLAICPLIIAERTENGLWHQVRVTLRLHRHQHSQPSLPLTIRQARRKGWTQIGNCGNHTTFRGQRFVNGNDSSLMLLYDINGNIAGVQCAIAKAGLPDDYPPRRQIGNIFQDDGNRYVLTVYFSPPNMICSTGEVALHLRRPRGLGLYIQTGSNPVMQHIHISAIMESQYYTQWVFQHPCTVCHYWYNLFNQHTLTYDNFLPIVLMVRNNRLFGFGWLLGVYQASPNFEHPPIFNASTFMESVPYWFDDRYINQSSLRISMNNFNYYRM